MKNNVLTILMAITMALVCVLVAVTFTNGINNEVSGSKDVVTVYGQGKISLKPDVAYITMGYENVDIDPKKAQEQNTEMMGEIIKALENQGLEDSDIQTSRYNVFQERDYDSGSIQIVGYKVTNIISVKISDVDKASDIINVAIAAGGNVFYGISFDVIDRQAAYLDAMALALERAKEKAVVYAQKEGRQISGVHEINEKSVSKGSYQNQISNYLELSYTESRQGVAAADGSSISSGQVEISATVTVIYELN